jgi:hypothetical protein
MHTRWNFLVCVTTVLSGLCATASGQHYNFGFVKRTVTLERRLLPDVELGNVSLAVVFPRGTAGLDGNLFSSDLETLVAQSGGGIRLVNKDPEFEIRCFTTGYQTPHITQKTENKVTTREAHGFAMVDARLIRVADGAVALSFSEAVRLDASNYGGSGTLSLQSLHLPGFGNKGAAPVASSSTDSLADSDNDTTLTQRMTRTLAMRVASHMVQMNERVPVLLAQGGALDEADRLAMNGRWSEYLEQLSTLAVPSDPSSAAYLLYDTGVANEALGYGASDAKAALKYLQESSIDYSRAIQDKPSEKYFLDPQKRIETAITRY